MPSSSSLSLAFLLFPAVLNGISLGQFSPGNQQSTCSVFQQLGQSPTCNTSPTCCTRLDCTVFLNTVARLQLFPCTTPPSINIELLQGQTILFNRTFQNSQDIRIPGASVLPPIHLQLDQAQNYSSVTFSLRFGRTTVIPETSIPIDRSQCSSDLSPNACPTSALPTTGPSSSPLSTCQSLQGLANRLGTCDVDSGCSQLHCTFLNQYPADMSIEPCEDPPSVTIVVKEREGGAVIVNETLTQSHTQPVVVGGSHVLDLTVLIEHQDNPDVMAVTVLASPTSLPTNITLIPRTVIPLDRSNCTSIGIHTNDVPLPPTSTTTTESATCMSLKQLSGTIQGACHTDVACVSVLCDLSLVGLSYSSNLTVLPCLDVPGIQLVIVNNQNNEVILDRKLTKSGQENITITRNIKVTLNETVIQSPDLSSLIVQVDVIFPQLLPPFSLLPRTEIPLDRCNCPNIDCTASSPGPVSPTAQSPTTQSPTTHPSSIALTDNSTPKSSSGVPLIVLPVAVVGGVLLIALVAVVAAAVAYFIYLKKKKAAYGFQRMSFEEVKDED